jgi:hypothetical protein
MRHGKCCPKFCEEHYQSSGKSLSDRFIAWGGKIIIIDFWVRETGTGQQVAQLQHMIYDDDV